MPIENWLAFCAIALLASGKILGKIFGSTFIGAGCFLASASK